MTQTGYTDAAAVLPDELRSRAKQMERQWSGLAEEFRLRAGRDASVLLPDGEHTMLPNRPVSVSDLHTVLERATGASLHSAYENLRSGFVTTRTGCRVGVCGSAVCQGDSVKTIRDFSSLSIRIPRQCFGAADSVYDRLPHSPFPSVLLISPPGGGKTTLLRELIRRLSEDGHRVCLADERGEVAAVCEGVPRFDVGPCTDVLTGGIKAVSAVMLIRSMSPQILALDEITAPGDVEACITAANCGVGILASAHASALSDLGTRPLYRRLLEQGIFTHAVMIHNRGRSRTYDVEALT